MTKEDSQFESGGEKKVQLAKKFAEIEQMISVMVKSPPATRQTQLGSFEETVNQMEKKISKMENQLLQRKFSLLKKGCVELKSLAQELCERELSGRKLISTEIYEVMTEMKYMVNIK